MWNGFGIHMESIVAIYEINYSSHFVVRLLPTLTSLGVLGFMGLRVGVLATM